MACICDNASAPLRLEAWGGALELELVARALAPHEDHRHVHFHGSWGRAPGPACAARRRLPPPGGRFYLTYPYRYAPRAWLNCRFVHYMLSIVIVLLSLKIIV